MSFRFNRNFIEFADPQGSPCCVDPAGVLAVFAPHSTAAKQYTRLLTLGGELLVDAKYADVLTALGIATADSNTIVAEEMGPAVGTPGDQQPGDQETGYPPAGNPATAAEASKPDAHGPDKGTLGTAEEPAADTVATAPPNTRAN